jgi:CBS domain-containing protein
MKVRDLPPGPLLKVKPDTSLAAVARHMRLDDCDSVAVMTNDRLLGIITERDLVRAIADGVDPQQARADMFMSADPATVGADEDLSVVAVKMMALGIRHLPVVDAKGAPVGLISARDLVAVLDRGKR